MKNGCTVFFFGPYRAVLSINSFTIMFDLFSIDLIRMSHLLLSYTDILYSTYSEMEMCLLRTRWDRRLLVTFRVRFAACGAANYTLSETWKSPHKGPGRSGLICTKLPLQENQVGVGSEPRHLSSLEICMLLGGLESVQAIGSKSIIL